VSGKVDLERLIVEVVHTLRDAHMPDTLRALDERVLSLQPEELFETADDGSESRFKPMLELLLRELTALGTSTSLSVVERETRALEAMHLAGF
jgi:hypothetical protein